MRFNYQQSPVPEFSSSTMDRLLSIPVISKSAEQALARRIARGDDEAINELVLANTKLVLHIAKQFHWTGLEVEDLFAEGMIGLRTAAERYRARGNKFSVFACWHIRRQIQKIMTSQGRAYRVPLRIEILANKARAIRDSLPEGSGLTADLLTEKLDCTRKSAVSAMQILQAPIALDADINAEAGDGTFAGLIPDASARNGAAELNRMDRIEELKRLLSCLNAKERFVIEHRFGIDGRNEATLKDVGDLLKITRERVRQIEFKALRKLREAESKMRKRTAALGRAA